MKIAPIRLDYKYLDFKQYFMDALLTHGEALQARGWIVAPWLRRLASARLTLAIIVLLALGVIVYAPAAGRGAWLVVTPLTLGAVNLIAAILTNGVLRRNTALLMFHFALLAIVVLAAAGRLTYLKGQLELAEGETFTGQLTQSESGPWHRSRLEQAAFRNDGYTIRYAKGIKRADTRNAVQWLDDVGHAQQAVIGDHTPLTRQGYKFYTSFNKGFAPVFVWQPHAGAAARQHQPAGVPDPRIPPGAGLDAARHAHGRVDAVAVRRSAARPGAALATAGARAAQAGAAHRRGPPRTDAGHATCIAPGCADL